MANLNIEPGDQSLEQLIQGIEHGVLMRTNRSWSIDDARNKFQFGCEWGQLIENGELKGVVKNPNYRGISAQFWKSLRAVGDASTSGSSARRTVARANRTRSSASAMRHRRACSATLMCLGRCLMSTLNNEAEAFKVLVDWLRAALLEQEQFTLGYAAESSAFVRFNHALVRQAGQVQQANVSFKLIDDGRHADLQITLSGDTESDLQRLSEGLQQLRDTLPLLPRDPYLLLNHNHWQSYNVQDHPLPDTEQAVAEITRAAKGLDLVGFYAAGPISRGFASSSGAFGWHQANSFNFDFSLFHENGQAVKASYAGHAWSSEGFAQRFEQAREQLAFLGRPLRTLPPGEYRAYLAPAALEEIMGMLSWGGFSARAIAASRARCRSSTPTKQA